MRNHRTVLAGSFFFILCGLLLNSCAVTVSVGKDGRGSLASGKFIRIYKIPRIEQLKPYECPCYGTCKIKTKPEPKTYGKKYAKRQNRNMKDAI